MNAESNVARFPERARDCSWKAAATECLLDTMLDAASRAAEELRAAKRILTMLKAEFADSQPDD